MNTSKLNQKKTSSNIVVFNSQSTKDTVSFGVELGKELRKTRLEIPAVLCLFGELGSGKTTLIKGIAKGLGIKNKIVSPTFLIMRIYKVPKTKFLFHHIDAYRIKNNKEALILKNERKLFMDKHNIVVIEWPEKISNLVPKNKIKIKLCHKGKNRRIIKLSN